MANPNATPASPLEEQPTIGLIGMGEMGKMYARHLSAAGWKKIHVCDLPQKYEALKHELAEMPGIVVLRDGHLVSRSSDFIIYSVEAEYIDKVVKEYGPSTKLGAIVAGQTSVKAPERAAFESYLPEDVHIVSCHSLHGPTVPPLGQPLVLIHHRGPDWALTLVENILRPLRSRFVYMSFEEHDSVTANTQAVTHAAFLSMGTAWRNCGSYPWEQPEGRYVGGIETVKVNIMHRIYANKWHIYAGLAILNPSAKVQIEQYAKSATELFKLMLETKEAELRGRVYRARDTVFRDAPRTRPILLSENLLDRFSLGTSRENLHDVPQEDHREQTARLPPNANSHLSLLAMVDCWATLSINPFADLEVAATPIFRMWIGVAEYLFRSRERLDAALDAALWDTTHRSDDLEFIVAARGWSQCVSFGNFDLYRRRFEKTASFFKPRFAQAQTLASKMITAILEEGNSS
ncbi:Probable prephenate dehydrogenase [NADP(+)] Short=PRDH [Serendipita indica DSM 11827]|uniref:Prephenate dehydrogenase [NADP(+)] n=1 Tax=Serendipita indica (strain DSM 11827) TaxID=1109443 RepID=G4TFN9_SERID|nr:Probable prephenate dehydrogenase [NADP(+)] Short=PRDH [Serendipita indica DSM 11827]CCA70143.1 probable TYR1-prephenate dehydrogenase (NADP+) [Serendipita indica DSM 11827]